MADPRDETLRLLQEHGAVLSRSHRHQVWKLPDGRVFTRSKSPGSTRCGPNELAQLRRLLGLSGKHTEPEMTKVVAPKPKRRRRMPAVFGIGGGWSDTPKRAATAGFETLLGDLYAVARQTMPRYRECVPVDRRVVMQTPLTTWMRRWLA